MSDSKTDDAIKGCAGTVVTIVLLGLAFYVIAHVDRAYFQWLSTP